MEKIKQKIGKQTIWRFYNIYILFEVYNSCFFFCSFFQKSTKATFGPNNIYWQLFSTAVNIVLLYLFTAVLYSVLLRTQYSRSLLWQPQSNVKLRVTNLKQQLETNCSTASSSRQGKSAPGAARLQYYTSSTSNFAQG